MYFVDKALEVATKAHKGQTRWGGEPYITHPVAVAETLQSPLDKAVALLHDVVEDTNVTLADLRKDFSPAIVEAVDAVTKRKDEDYDKYLQRVADNQTAIRVKIADIEHNLKSLKRGSMKGKYQVALLYLRLVREYERVL